MRYTTRIIVPPRVRRSGPPGSPGGAYGPQVLGVRNTFGFGDRLGTATSAHLAVATAHPELAPVLAQQSARDAAATGRSAAEVVGSAARAVSAARFRTPWGAEANRLRSAQEVADAAEAGFTCFTFDPSEWVRPDVETLSPAELQAGVDALVAEGDLPDHWTEPYLGRTVALPGGYELRITLEPLQRAVLRYAPAVLHCARLSSALVRASQGRPFEVEVSLDRVDAPATTLDHLFIGLELESRGVRLTGLGLRLPEATADLEQQLRRHAAVAEFCGPYKLVFDEPGYPADLYPLVGRICQGAWHVKTSAASYLEALRVVAEVEPTLFQEIAAYSLCQGDADDTVQGLPLSPAGRQELAASLEAGQKSGWLDAAPGRRLLDGAFGEIMTTGQNAAGQPFKTAILEVLDRHADVYASFLAAFFEQQFAWLQAG